VRRVIVATQWHTHTHTRARALGRTSLYEGSARRRDFYLTTNNTHNIQTSMPRAGFEPASPASERPPLNRATTATGTLNISDMEKWIFVLQNRYEIFTCRSLLIVTGRLASTCYEDQAGGRRLYDRNPACSSTQSHAIITARLERRACSFRNTGRSSVHNVFWE